MTALQITLIIAVGMIVIALYLGFKAFLTYREGLAAPAQKYLFMARLLAAIALALNTIVLLFFGPGFTVVNVVIMGALLTVIPVGYVLLAPRNAQKIQRRADAYEREVGNG